MPRCPGSKVPVHAQIKPTKKIETKTYSPNKTKLMMRLKKYGIDIRMLETEIQSGHKYFPCVNGINAVESHLEITSYNTREYCAIFVYERGGMAGKREGFRLHFEEN